jgi:hypothetical protein
MAYHAIQPEYNTKANSARGNDPIFLDAFFQESLLTHLNPYQ